MHTSRACVSKQYGSPEYREVEGLVGHHLSFSVASRRRCGSLVYRRGKRSSRKKQAGQIRWSGLSSKFRAPLQDRVVEVPAYATRNPHQRGLVAGGEATKTIFFPVVRES